LEDTTTSKARRKVATGGVAAAIVLGLFSVCLSILDHEADDTRRLHLAFTANALELYRRRQGHLPRFSPVDLALVEDRELEDEPLEHWGRPFVIAPIASGLRVTSLGADGKPGGSGDDAGLSVDVAGP
jgi:hypothetical protein